MEDTEKNAAKSKFLVEMKEALVSAFNDANNNRKEMLLSDESRACYTQSMAQVGALILEIEDRLENNKEKGSFHPVTKLDQRPS